MVSDIAPASVGLDLLARNSGVEAAVQVEGLGEEVIFLGV